MTPENQKALDDEFAVILAAADDVLMAEIIIAIANELEAIQLSPS